MKRTVTFQLDPKVWNILVSLADKMGTTKTEVLSKAIESYADNNTKGKNTLLRYANSLEKDAADQMLDDIYLTRLNKEGEDEKVSFGH